MICEAEEVPDTKYIAVMSLMGQHPTESPCDPDKRLELGEAAQNPRTD